jgi:hypothetical protein
MKIKLVVGEIRELMKIPHTWRSKNGFYCFMVEIQWRLDEDTGEVEFDDVDLRKLHLYMQRGYKLRLLKIFGRTLGPDSAGLNLW